MSSHMLKEDPEVVRKKLAERRMLCAKMKNDWILRRGVHESRGHVCLERLFGRHCKQWGYRDILHCPGCASAVGHPVWDHMKIWVKKDRGLLITLHPYATRAQVVRAFKALGDKYPVKLTIHRRKESWWYPGVTLFVEVER